MTIDGNRREKSMLTFCYLSVAIYKSTSSWKRPYYSLSVSKINLSAAFHFYFRCVVRSSLSSLWNDHVTYQCRQDDVEQAAEDGQPDRHDRDRPSEQAVTFVHLDGVQRLGDRRVMMCTLQPRVSFGRSAHPCVRRTLRDSAPCLSGS